VTGYAAYMGSASGLFNGTGTVTTLLELLRAAARLAEDVDDSTMPVVRAEDLADVHKSRRGDPEAYRRLVQRYQQHVAQILWRFTRDRLVHEELVQEVFVQAYISLGTYRGRAPFSHWLARIATRVGYHYWKRQQRSSRRQYWSYEQWQRLAAEPAADHDPSELASLLHELLAQLPPRDRLVLTLRYLQGCDVAETARRIGWSKAMVKVQTGRARKKLLKLFQRSVKERLQ